MDGAHNIGNMISNKDTIYTYMYIFKNIISS